MTAKNICEHSFVCWIGLDMSQQIVGLWCSLERQLISFLKRDCHKSFNFNACLSLNYLILNYDNPCWNLTFPSFSFSEFTSCNEAGHKPHPPLDNSNLEAKKKLEETGSLWLLWQVWLSNLRWFHIIIAHDSWNHEQPWWGGTYPCLLTELLHTA